MSLRRANTKKLILPVLVIASAMVALLGLVLLMNPSTYKYYISSPNDPASRRAMIIKLKGELRELLEMEASDPTKSGANDPDRYWPLDRTHLVLGINEYIAETGRHPKALKDLKNGNMTKEPTAAFNLTSSKAGWRLFLNQYLIAEGN